MVWWAGTEVGAGGWQCVSLADTDSCDQGRLSLSRSRYLEKQEMISVFTIFNDLVSVDWLGRNVFKVMIYTNIQLIDWLYQDSGSLSQCSVKYRGFLMETYIVKKEFLTAKVSSSTTYQINLCVCLFVCLSQPWNSSFKRFIKPIRAQFETN